MILIPQEGNRIYGDDVPLPWKEAARETGIPNSTFYALLTRREIAMLKLGRRLMVRPSAIREYLKRVEVPAV